LEPVVELLFWGLQASWAPIPYGGPVCIAHPSGRGFTLAIGDASGEVVAAEKLFCPVTYVDDAPARVEAPTPEDVSAAWLRLVVAAWSHLRKVAAQSASTTAGEG
jgi:hypothetical protein